jgi:hypothetical protein
VQIISLVVGIIAFVGMFLFTLPCLGAFNWLNIPLAVIGLIIGTVALVTNKGGSRGTATAGVVLSAIAVVWGLVRLLMGGGLV